MDSPLYIIAVDVGSTSVKAHLYDNTFQSVKSVSNKLSILTPDRGHAEYDPEEMFEILKLSILDLIKDYDVNQIKCMGLTCARNTFLVFEKQTGKPYHNLISWQDLRSATLTNEWNNSYTMKTLNKVSGALWYVTRQNKFLAASCLQFASVQVTTRLLWMIQNNPKLADAVQRGEACYAGLETWLLYRLTGTYAVDHTSAAATAFYDTFDGSWSPIVCKMLNIPSSIFPPVVDSCGLIGTCDVSLFGAPIPVTSLLADQSASLFGLSCHRAGDIKVTLGTGSFVDLNTGSRALASAVGLYPLVAWSINGERTFMFEGPSSDSGNSIDWLRSVGVVDDVAETAKMAYSVSDSGGVYFVPAFSGLQAPVQDDHAACLLLGLKPGTRQEHIVRAVLEAIVFRIVQLHRALLDEAPPRPGDAAKPLRVDGGVSRNDFVCQLMSDLLDRTVIRPANAPDVTARGAAMMAALGAGLAKRVEDLVLPVASGDEVTFQPNPERAAAYDDVFDQWLRAVDRSRDWYAPLQ